MLVQHSVLSADKVCVSEPSGDRCWLLTPLLLPPAACEPPSRARRPLQAAQMAAHRAAKQAKALHRIKQCKVALCQCMWFDGQFSGLPALHDMLPVTRRSAAGATTERTGTPCTCEKPDTSVAKARARCSAG